MLAGKTSQTVECQLHHVSPPAWSAAPAYETISYCWGDISQRETIIVSGSTVGVHRNSVEALRRTRYEHEGRMVWIDAICINQNDVEERNQQVSMMGEIYRTGWRNLICLVDADNLFEASVLTDAMDHIVPMMRQVSYSLSKDHFSVWVAHMLQAENWRPNRPHMDTWGQDDVSSSIRTLFGLFSHPWFGRIWVVQEVTLAASNMCYCGAAEVDFNVLMTVAIALWRERRDLPATLNCWNTANAFRLARHTERWRESPDYIFFSLIDQFKSFGAKDPRDKIFALSGMFQA